MVLLAARQSLSVGGELGQQPRSRVPQHVLDLAAPSARGVSGCARSSFQNDLLRALALNGRHIERYLSTYFSPNTHLLGEAVALFLIGTLYPQLSSAEEWKKNGWRIIQEEAVRQVRPDGVYFEQSLYYHVYALDFFLHARLLASRNGMEIPSGFDLRHQKDADGNPSSSARRPARRLRRR